MNEMDTCYPIESRFLVHARCAEDEYDEEDGDDGRVRPQAGSALDGNEEHD